MYSFMANLFSDKSDGLIFECFSIWHLLYLVMIVALIAFTLFRLKNKPYTEKKKTVDLFINTVFGLYIADFFLMPFALGEIDIDKLPFHACTSMCVACFWSSHSRRLNGLRIHFALLGMLSGLMYMVYPSGVAAYGTHPFSYRAIQTLLFHSLMVVYGFLVIFTDEKGLNIKACYKDALILAALTCWAFIGNNLYSGESADYSRYFNWFFIRRDPFALIPESVAPYLTPIVNFAVFLLSELLIYLIYMFIRTKLKKSAIAAEP